MNRFTLALPSTPLVATFNFCASSPFSFLSFVLLITRLFACFSCSLLNVERPNPQRFVGNLILRQLALFVIFYLFFIRAKASALLYRRTLFRVWVYCAWKYPITASSLKKWPFTKPVNSSIKYKVSSLLSYTALRATLRACATQYSAVFSPRRVINRCNP